MKRLFFSSFSSLIGPQFRFSSSLKLVALGLITFSMSLSSAHAQAEIVVDAPGNANITDNSHTESFGTVDRTSGTTFVSRTFTINNTGDATLTGVVVSITGATDFAVTSSPSATVSAGGSTNFTVTFNPSSTGAKTAALDIASSDSDENPFDISLSGTATEAEIAVDAPSASDITSGSHTETFTTVDRTSGTTSVQETFTIRNTGNANLTVSISNSNTTDFQVTSSPTSPVSGSGSTNFTVTFNPQSAGSKSATLTITNNDLDEGSFTINLSGTATEAEVAVEQPIGTDVSDGGTVDFGSPILGSATRSVFVIKNDGTAPLTVNTPVISGANASDFNLEEVPDSPVSALGSTDFSVSFTPTSEGSKTAELSFTNNDLSEGTFNITLTGNGAPTPAGSDQFGYEFSTTSLNDLTLDPSDPDVVEVVFDGGTDSTRAINIGFTFYFYEEAYTNFFLNTSSLMQFSSPATVDYTPDAIPTANGLNNFIAPFWTDLRLGDTDNSNTNKVYYKTFGTAPNRIFMIEFINVEEFYNAGAKISFEVLLYEGSNRIEIQLNERTGATNTNNRVGIENIDGTDGIDVQDDISNVNITTFPQAFVFDRPVVVDVTSEIESPISGLIEEDIGLVEGSIYPKPGTQIREPYGTNVQFSAPEFIYFNQSFVELEDMGDADDPDPNKIAYYRARNKGYTIVGQELTAGTEFVFQQELVEDITVNWIWELEYAVFVDYVDAQGNLLTQAGGPGNGIGNPSPEVGRVWVAKDTEFISEVDRIAGNDFLSSDTGGFRYTAKSYTFTDASGSGTPVTQGDTGNRLVTEPVTITDWLRVQWEWEGQVRYRFSAEGEASLGNSSFTGQSFVRIYQGDGSTIESTNFGLGSINDVWVDIGRKVEVGAFYRTADRCFTLGNFPSTPGGNLAAIGNDISKLQDISLDDNEGDERVARVWTVNAASLPTEVNFVYASTIFRAEVPLGSSFDPANANAALVPNLCGDTAELDDAGPDFNAGFNTFNYPDENLVGNPVRWDPVSKKLFPVHPGSFQIEWADENEPDKVYKIEIVSGYPDDLALLSSSREDEDGMRQTTTDESAYPILDSTGVQLTDGTDPLYYVREIDLASVSSDFPAEPDAHYRHLFDVRPERDPITKLDISATDEWAFQEITFSDSDVDAVADVNTSAFTVSGAGRSVLLYSYRPNPDEIADGNLSEEALAVRVVRSAEVNPGDPYVNVLGLKSFKLIGGEETDLDSAVGVVSTGTSSTLDLSGGIADSKGSFVIDFWLNASELGREEDDSLTIFSMGDDKLTVKIDAVSSTVTADYFGMNLSQPLVRGGGSWHHYIIHLYSSSFFGIPITSMHFYLDSNREENGSVNVALPVTTPTFTIGSNVTADSLRFGAGASAQDGVQIDNFRLFIQDNASLDRALTSGEVGDLQENTTGSFVLKEQMLNPVLWFNFELSGNPGVNIGSLSNVEIDGIDGILAELNIEEVATRIDNVFDRAGFGGSGYILNAVSNYNSSLYSRDSEVGTWGPIFPVNGPGFYNADKPKLEVAYYENPFLTDAALHPNVAWPYVAALYDDIVYPTRGKFKDSAIYIASRIGSEGVDTNGRLQQIFDLSEYANLTIYNQPNTAIAGYNPNEEHAIAAASGRAALNVKNLGDDVANNPPLAAFALQNEINVTSGNGYTSHPWVLIQVDNLLTGEPEMAAYQVLKTRDGGIPFPRPSDGVVNNTSGLDYESAENPEDRFLTIDPDGNSHYSFEYKFDYPVTAGDLLVPPYPLNIVIGNVTMLDAWGGNVVEEGEEPQRTFWRDVNGNAWVVSGGDGQFFYQYFYPYRSDFYLLGANPGEPVAWLPDDADDGFLGNNTRGDPSQTDGEPNPQRVQYTSSWGSDYPKLKRGETLTYQGGEYFNETPGATGLPALVAMKAAEIVYDAAIPSMNIGLNNFEDYSAWIVRSLDRREASFTTAQMGDAGFTPAETEKVFVVAERWYFKELSGSLQQRFYFNSLTEKLVFRGYLNDKDSGDPNLTAGPDPVNLLQPNVMTSDERDEILALSDIDNWNDTVQSIFVNAQNPNNTRQLVSSEDNNIVVAQAANPDDFLAGLRELPEVTLALNEATEDQREILEAQDATVQEIAQFWNSTVTSNLETARNDYASARDDASNAFDDASNEFCLLGSDLNSLSDKYTALQAAAQAVADAYGSVDFVDVVSAATALATEAGNFATDVTDCDRGFCFFVQSNCLENKDDDSNLDDLIAALDTELESVASSSELFERSAPDEDQLFIPLDSFGVGSSLIPNPKLLIADTSTGSHYITIAENNRAELNGAAISLHIIEIIPDRYRGALSVIEAADAFSEKVTIQHNGEFGGNTGELYYEWWIRDAAPLDLVAEEILDDGTLKEVDDGGNTLWQEYIPSSRAELTDEVAKRLGSHTIVFEGRPDVVLADKLVLMRYRYNGRADDNGNYPDAQESDWNLVPFEVADSATAWQPGTPAPFQWAGAANSPQLQADGSKRYIPQLVMGWVKRVLDRINPYEARYTDFFNNESPATYSSQIQIAGPPFAGSVALNSDKNVIENTGLIELYETVLARALSLSIDNSSNGVGTDGIQQALLLAATRLTILYELLAREAYSDAQDPTITVSEDSDLGSVAAYTHAFQNMEASLMHEELALLRGTDFLKSYPVYNRIFWNYAKGLGEAAYNVNYNIYDENANGFINEDDARALYPQGHGDSWGHFLSALGMHYTLLQNPGFNWLTRSELYSLMDNVLEVDYLDEKTFAKLAAARARTGRDIVRGTYRLAYTQDPDGQWQGYTDTVEPARAWGVSEWASRCGQAAYFDWGVANALLPDEAADATPLTDPENLDRIERLGAIDEIGEVAAGLHEIQVAIDEANGGVNPLGFDSGALTFDLNQEFYENDSGGDRRSHFDQIYLRALTAAGNALETLEFAAAAENKLRAIADDTDALIFEAFSQDLDFRNRLIEIFGQPYDGTIGFGKVYDEGYEGPDTMLYAYLDRTTITDIIPTGVSSQSDVSLDAGNPDFVRNFDNIRGTVIGLANNGDLNNIYRNGGDLNTAVETYITGNTYQDPTSGGNGYDDVNETFTMPIRRAADYAFQAEEDWGQRASYGKIQQTLQAILLEEIALKGQVDNYIGFLGDFETLTRRLLSQIDLFDSQESNRDTIDVIRRTIGGIFLATDTIINVLEIATIFSQKLADTIGSAAPSSVGFSNDVGAIARGIAEAADLAAATPLEIAKNVNEIVKQIAEFTRDETIANHERNITRLEAVAELEGMMAEVEQLSGSNGPFLAEIGANLQQLEILKQEYFTALSEGFRLLKEREAYNTTLAATVQRNRYQDMIFRLARNEAMAKYQSAFNHAARYTWLAARAYDYETSLEPGHPAAPGAFLDKIVKERQLGLWVDGEPQSGQGGLAEILHQLNANFQVLRGQLGIDNPQSEAQALSLRSELFRIGPTAAAGGTAASDVRWEDSLKARIVPDLRALPEFVRYCRPFSTSEEGEQPGIVIRFSSEINNGVNFFGKSLIEGDHAYSTANFATKIREVAIALKDYSSSGLSVTPRCYLVPVGNDYLRTSSTPEPEVRMFSITEQRIPVPFTINQSDISDPGYIPTLNGVDGGFAELRRHGDFVMHNDTVDGVDFDTRLVSRSVWNSEWLLIIPGAGLDADPMTGLEAFAENVTDIELNFLTYSHQGQ